MIDPAPVLPKPQGELIIDPELRERIDNRQKIYWDGIDMDYDLAIHALVQDDPEWWLTPRETAAV